MAPMKSGSNMTAKTKKQLVLYSAIILIIYFICFGFLSMHQFKDWALFPFFESMLGVFMGAGAIAIITGIILVFQSIVESERNKKQKVFDKKMDLYQSIITEMKEKFKVKEGEDKPKITSEERMDLFFTQLNIALLSKPKTFRLFSEMLNDISDEEGNITDGASKKLLRFIEEAREDLDVQEPMTAEDRANFSAAVEIAEQEAEKTTKPYQRTMYSRYEEWKKKQIEKAPKSEKSREKLELSLEMFEFIHEQLQMRFGERSNFEMKYAKTSGCTCYAENKKFLELNFQRMGTVSLFLLKDFKNDYRIPNIPPFITTHPRNYDPDKPSSAAFGEQYVLTVDNLVSINENIDILISLSERSFEIASHYRDKILKIFDSDNLKKATPEDLEKQTKYLHSDYKYDYQR